MALMTLFSLMTLNNPRQQGLAHLSVQRGHSPECRCMHTKAFLASPGRCPIDTLTSHAWKSPSPPLPEPASPWPSHLRKWQLHISLSQKRGSHSPLQASHPHPLYSIHQVSSSSTPISTATSLVWAVERRTCTLQYPTLLLCVHKSPGHIP